MGINITAETNADIMHADLVSWRTVGVPEGVNRSIDEILRLSKARLEIYPPATAGNQPPPPYYERQVGMIGFKGPIPGKKSQKMTTVWQYGTTGTGGWLRNPATYSGLVHDRLLQTWFHGAHGWPIAEHVVMSFADDPEAPTKFGQAVNIARNIMSSIRRN